jgi:hypothetical protein
LRLNVAHKCNVCLQLRRTVGEQKGPLIEALQEIPMMAREFGRTLKRSVLDAVCNRPGLELLRMILHVLGKQGKAVLQIEILPVAACSAVFISMWPLLAVVAACHAVANVT